MIREHETYTSHRTAESVIDADVRNVERVATASRMESRSFSELLKDLRDETTLLVRQEIELAKTEMSEKAAKAGRNAGYIGAGSAIAHAAAILLLLGLAALLYHGLVAAGLEHMTAGWLAPLIVGGVLALVGYMMIQKGVSTLKRESLVPRKTVDSLKENQQWLSRKATA